MVTQFEILQTLEHRQPESSWTPLLKYGLSQTSPGQEFHTLASIKLHSTSITLVVANSPILILASTLHQCCFVVDVFLDCRVQFCGSSNEGWKVVNLIRRLRLCYWGHEMMMREFGAWFQQLVSRKWCAPQHCSKQFKSTPCLMSCLPRVDSRIYVVIKNSASPVANIQFGD